MLLVALLLAFLALTLPQAPYPRQSLAPDKVVHVVGKQFSFAISAKPITSDADFANVLGKRGQIPAGEWVEFRVPCMD